MRLTFSGKTSRGLAPGNSEGPSHLRGGPTASLLPWSSEGSARMVQSRLTPSRTGPQASLGAAEPTIPPQGADSVLRTPGSCATAPNPTDVKAPYEDRVSWDMSRHTPSRTTPQPSPIVAEATIPHQGVDSRRLGTIRQNSAVPMKAVKAASDPARLRRRRQ